VLKGFKLFPYQEFNEFAIHLGAFAVKNQQNSHYLKSSDAKTNKVAMLPNLLLRKFLDRLRLMVVFTGNPHSANRKQ